MNPNHPPTTIELASGTLFDLARPDPALVHLEDIATALAKICRWNGHCKGHFSVAEHSVNCALNAEARGKSQHIIQLALLHDAAEAYFGDITSPVKAALGAAVKALENPIQAAILEALSIDPPTVEEAAQVKLIDKVMLTTEASLLLPSGGSWFTVGAPVDEGVTPEDAGWEDAFQIFMGACLFYGVPLG